MARAATLRAGTVDTAGVEAGKDSGGAAGKAMWEAIPSPYAGAM